MVRRFAMAIGLSLILVASMVSVASAQGVRDQPSPTAMDPNTSSVDVMMRIHERIHPLMQQFPPEVREQVHALMHQWMMGGMEMGVS